jgi:hypothetical protein
MGTSAEQEQCLPSEQSALWNAPQCMPGHYPEHLRQGQPDCCQTITKVSLPGWPPAWRATYLDCAAAAAAQGPMPLPLLAQLPTSLRWCRHRWLPAALRQLMPMCWTALTSCNVQLAGQPSMQQEQPTSPERSATADDSHCCAPANWNAVSALPTKIASWSVASSGCAYL